MTENTDVAGTAKEQRITKKRLHEFIENTENALFADGSEPPKSWQDLRLFAGLDRLSATDLADRRQEELRKRIATKKATVDEVQEYANLVAQSGS